MVSQVQLPLCSHRSSSERVIDIGEKGGAVIVAKANMGEFASRYVGSAFGVTRNPYDPRRNPSGSSGGTGAGVAANYASVGIGEDTGGSIRGPAAVASLVGLRPSVPLVSRFGMMPANPTQDTLGPIARTVRDAAILLDAIVGYDPNVPITAYSVGQVPPTCTAFLATDGLQDARLGVIREPMDPRADPASDDYKKVRAVIDKAIADLKRLGAEIVDPIAIPDLKDRVRRVFDDNVFETEQATNKYLAEHANAPAKTLREILLSGKVVPWRAKTLLDKVGRSTDQPGYLRILLAREETRELILKIRADNRLDALVYATFGRVGDGSCRDSLSSAPACAALMKSTIAKWLGVSCPRRGGVDDQCVGAGSADGTSLLRLLREGVGADKGDARSHPAKHAPRHHLDVSDVCPSDVLRAGRHAADPQSPI